MVKRSVITLVGVRQAKKGTIFIYKGPSPDCVSCEYYQVCIKNLEVGRVYEVVRLGKKVFPCKLHEKGVRVVEVVEPNILAALTPKLAIEGAVINFQARECYLQACEQYELCDPQGLVEEDRCEVLKIDDRIACSRGLSLVKTLLRRLPAF